MRSTNKKARRRTTGKVEQHCLFMSRLFFFLRERCFFSLFFLRQLHATQGREFHIHESTQEAHSCLLDPSPIFYRRNLPTWPTAKRKQKHVRFWFSTFRLSYVLQCRRGLPQITATRRKVVGTVQYLWSPSSLLSTGLA